MLPNTVETTGDLASRSFFVPCVQQTDGSKSQADPLLKLLASANFRGNEI